MLGSPLATAITETQIDANKKSTGKLIETSIKRNEAFERFKNAQKGLQKDAFILAGGTAATAAAAATVSKSEAAQKVLKESFAPIKKAFCESKFGKSTVDACKGLVDDVKPFIKKGFAWVKALPTPAKAVIGVGAGLTALATTINGAITRKKDEQIIREYGAKQGEIQAQYK